MYLAIFYIANIKQKELVVEAWAECIDFCPNTAQFKIRVRCSQIKLTNRVGFNWWISFAPEFQCDYFCESSCLFYLSLNSDFYVSKIMHL